MMKRALFVAVFAGLASAAAAAQNDSGCGLGSMLFKENKPAHQIVAATTNGLFGNQTFGITTGTLGCTSGGLIKASREREVFVSTNFRALQRELAAGQGEYASSLAALSGCQADSFGSFAKARYEKLVPSASTTPNELILNIDREIAADPAMAKACVL